MRTPLPFPFHFFCSVEADFGRKDAVGNFGYIQFAHICMLFFLRSGPVDFIPPQKNIHRIFVPVFILLYAKSTQQPKRKNKGEYTVPPPTRSTNSFQSLPGASSRLPPTIKNRRKKEKENFAYPYSSSHPFSLRPKRKRKCGGIEVFPSPLSSLHACADAN